MGIKLNTTSGGSATINPTDGTNNVTLNVPNSSGTILVGPDVAYPVAKPSLNLDFANSRQLDTRITFSRNQIGAYYDGKTVAKAEENLFTGSSDFSNATYWSVGGTVSTFTTGVTAPDGTTTAVTINEGTGTGYHQVTKTASSAGLSAGNTYTASIYAKNIDGRYINISCYSTSTAGVGVVFDLTTQTYTTSVTGSSGWSIVGAPVITNVTGTTWYRCSFTFVAGTGVTNIAYMMSSTGTLTNWNAEAYTGTSRSISIWGAQLEQRSSLTAYTPTTTSAITNYIPQLVYAPLNTPRFDYDIRPTLSGSGTVSGSTITLPATFADGSPSSTDNGVYKGNITIAGTSYPIVSCYNRVITVTGTPTTGTQVFTLTNPNVDKPLGLLVEESRTNLVTYSGAVGGTNWGLNNITPTANAAIAPDGTLTASNIIANTTTGSHSIVQSYATTTSNTYTVSCYIKAYTCRYIIFGLYADNNNNRYYVTFDALNGVFVNTQGVFGTLTNGSYSITAVGNGWYKAVVTATTSVAPTTSVGVRIWNPSNNAAYVDTTAYAGDGYSGVLMWGAQLEAGNEATSYIPTTTTIVTRGADISYMVGTNFSSWYNHSAGTLVVTNVKLGLTGTAGYIAGFNGITYGRNIRDTGVGIIIMRRGMPQGATTDYFIAVSPAKNVESKIAMTYINSTTTSTEHAAMNGVASSEQTANTASVPFSYFFIGCPDTTGFNIYSQHIRKISYYPVALTSSELQAITSI